MLVIVATRESMRSRTKYGQKPSGNSRACQDSKMSPQNWDTKCCLAYTYHNWLPCDPKMMPQDCIDFPADDPVPFFRPPSKRAKYCCDPVCYFSRGTGRRLKRRPRHYQGRSHSHSPESPAAARMPATSDSRDCCAAFACYYTSDRPPVLAGHLPGEAGL